MNKTDDEISAEVVFKLMSSRSRGFVEAMTKTLRNEHNTLQQSYMRNTAEIVSSFCDPNAYVDPRNENSMVFACKVKKLLETENIRFPFI